MAYRLEHTVNFRTVHNDMQISLDITTLNYKKLSQEQLAQAEAIAIDDLEIAQDNIFEPIRGRRISSRLIGRNGFGLSSLYSENPKKYRIEVKKDGTLMARSYLLASQSEEPYASDPYVFDIAGTVGFGDLKDMKYLDTTGTAFQQKQTYLDILFNCLDLIGLELPLWVVCESFAEGMDENKCPLLQTYINPLRFYPNNDPMTAYEVLQTLCTLFGAYICQSDGIWKFVQVEQLLKPVVRVFMFDADRKVGSNMSLSIEKVIASGTKVEDKPFINYDQRISHYDSIQLAQMEVDYGELQNRLYNDRFQLLDPTITGGQAARGWKAYNINYRFIKPEIQTIFKDNYIEIDGKATAYRTNDDPNIDGTQQGIKQLFTYNNKGYYVPELVGFDEYTIVSAPIIVNYDQVVKFSGEFLNTRCRGAKVQVVATPVSDNRIIPAIEKNPSYIIPPDSERYDLNLLLRPDGTWSPGYEDGNPTATEYPVWTFDNTKEKREGDYIVQVASGEWKSFEIESEPLPYLHPASAFFKIRSQYYLVRVLLFRGTEYVKEKDENPLPKDSNDPKIRFRNLNVGRRYYLDTQDIRKERYEVEQQKPYGIKREMVTLPIGSVNGDNYYSQLLDSFGKPQINWHKAGQSANKMPLPSLTLADILRVNGRPTKRVTGSVLHTSFDLLSCVRPGGLKGKYLIAGATQNLPSEQSRVVLAELYEYLPPHYRRYFLVDKNGKAVLQNEVYEDGDLPSNESDFLITFLEPNGPNGNSITITGSAIFGTAKAHWATFAWFDRFDNGPYTVTVQSLTYGQGLLDYQRIYSNIDSMNTTIEVPKGIEVYAIVADQDGNKVKRKILADYNQKQQISEVGKSCNGEFPVVNGLLLNSYPPIPSWSGRTIQPEIYLMEIVNLRTGEIIFANKAGEVKLDKDYTFYAQMPDEWDSNDYGIRIKGVLRGDVAGVIGQIERCKPTKPNWFSERYSDHYKKKNAYDLALEQQKV
ncbi:hypothetical protein [Siphonobacter sp. SORGH_AS_0500]|uniref:hypothetical protein n=1 Tax=Siphonobacter sp. SORGH_AS_0500 TaxID=1864824 RepID=UPI002856F6E8|nr:hypothetical protein [Siphonobacter sp. SORGH_AS_0500]MDR6194927.1 hypothetical protein [Siphonobacter sp. SORGH_AS_0500]